MATIAIKIGQAIVSGGDLKPTGRECVLELWSADERRPGVEVAHFNPDEVRALIDALTPYARRRPPWRGGKRKP